MLNILETPQRRLFTVSEAATYLGCSGRHLRKLSDLGRVTAKRVGSRRMFTLEALNYYVDNQPDWVQASRKVKGYPNDISTKI